MNRALAYGLMGAAQGGLSGLLQQWQQDREDIRTQKLLDAKMAEQRALEALKAQYQSAVNLEKVQLELSAGLERDAAKASQDAELTKQKQGFESEQNRLDRESEEKRSQLSAGATVRAATIRADNDNAPRPRGEQIWQLPSGDNVLVKPDEAPPKQGTLVWTNGGSVGVRQRGGTPGVGSALNGSLGAPAVGTPQPPQPPPAPATGDAPAPQARQAPDGHWYVPDPARPGKYLRVN